MGDVLLEPSAALLGQMPQPSIERAPWMSGITNLEKMLVEFLQPNITRLPWQAFHNDMIGAIGVSPSPPTADYFHKKHSYWFAFNRFIAIHPINDASEVTKLIAIVKMLSDFKLLNPSFLLVASKYATDYFERVVAEVVDCRRLYEWALRLQMEGLMEDEGISPWSGRT
ncbi:hypothetical protein GGS26DRAFT_598296, partial [Hypomontagnella submonticulosa]